MRDIGLYMLGLFVLAGIVAILGLIGWGGYSLFNALSFWGRIILVGAPFILAFLGPVPYYVGQNLSNEWGRK